VFDINDHRPVPLFSISMPPKVWRPKPPVRYIPLDYGNEIDDDYFIFRRFGKALFTDHIVPELPARTDICSWVAKRDQPEFDKVITIPTDLDPQIH
jgi:hypothetical protein